MEGRLGCYFGWSYDKTPSRECTDHDRLAAAMGYQQDYDSWNPFAINTALAFLIGADQAFKELCGSGTNLCEEFRNNPKKVIEKIKDVKLDIHGTGNPVKLFNDDGDGSDGYQIYNVQRAMDNPQMMTYVKVNRYITCIDVTLSYISVCCLFVRKLITNNRRGQT
jgi:hypothetical protein